MKDFAALIKTLDSTNKTTLKVSALAEYFNTATDADKVWAIAILSHRRPPRPVNTTLLREWASELADIPLWLFEESYHIVGDLAETIALVAPPGKDTVDKPLHQYLEDMIWLKTRTDEEKKEYLVTHWTRMDYYQRFVFTKLITGGFRIGVSQKLMTRALSQSTGLEEDLLAYKLMGNWDPSESSFRELILEEKEGDRLSRPYPFYLAYALEGDVENLGNIDDWSAEYKWDGIRSQVIIRDRTLFTWTRGEELVTDRYPEFEQFIGLIPDGTVFDGEILAYTDGEIGDFNMLQTRIGRKNITAALLKKVPVILKVYDLLEWEGKDIRQLPYSQRRKLLENLLQSSEIITAREQGLPLHLSEVLQLESWEAVAKAREHSREVKSEGLMLKHNHSPYLVGRKKGDWWKWKVEPLTVDAVLTYAMRGHGRRSNLFTDYTFALWDEREDGERELVTFAKAYSGLTDAEFRKVDAWIKRNTLERFGPVRSVTPHHVFEIAFEGIAESSRHKSGVATRFPRILRWRKDKNIEEANTLDDLKNLIP
ncbi:ATP-dependent DNA ligase [Zeaxanthinibacter enoshimensis]|uniref:ATP-dependent DNA ligase n=1 Tax=Zeaxanthinibacter enoshimensis TaxID=392009 RepID=UPI0035648C94